MMRLFPRRLEWGVGFFVALMAASLLTACASKSSETLSGPSADAVAAELAGKDSGGTSEDSGITQRSSGGSVTIDVTWDNPRTSGPPTFAVAMNTHSVELDGFDLGKLAVLRNDRGQEVRPLSWDAPPGGHHRSGTLAFPATDGSGKPLMGPGISSIQLVIRDVAGIGERTFKWELAP